MLLSVQLMKEQVCRGTHQCRHSCHSCYIIPKLLLIQHGHPSLPHLPLPPSSSNLQRARLFLLTSLSSFASSPLISCSSPLPPLLPPSNGNTCLLAHCRWLGRHFEPRDERADPVMRILIPRSCLALTHTHAHTDTHSPALNK